MEHKTKIWLISTKDIEPEGHEILIPKKGYFDFMKEEFKNEYLTLFHFYTDLFLSNKYSDSYNNGIKFSKSLLLNKEYFSQSHEKKISNYKYIDEEIIKNIIKFYQSNENETSANKHFNKIYCLTNPLVDELVEISDEKIAKDKLIFVSRCFPNKIENGEYNFPISLNKYWLIAYRNTVIKFLEKKIKNFKLENYEFHYLLHDEDIKKRAQEGINFTYNFDTKDTFSKITGNERYKDLLNKEKKLFQFKNIHYYYHSEISKMYKSIILDDDLFKNQENWADFLFSIIKNIESNIAQFNDLIEKYNNETKLDKIDFTIPFFNSDIELDSNIVKIKPDEIHEITVPIYLFFDKQLSKKLIDFIYKETIEKKIFSPILVKTQLNLLEKEKLGKEYFNLFETNSNLLNNSSIWFRIVDQLDNKNIKKYKKEFKKYYKLGLYKLDNAKENNDYNFKLSSINSIIESSSGHGSHITPKLYNSETQSKQDILDINKDESNPTHPELLTLHSANFRILLIDDKDGCENDAEGKCKHIPKNSKAHLIATLMNGKGFFEDDNFKKKLIWDEDKVKYYFYSFEKSKDDENKYDNSKDEKGKDLKFDIEKLPKPKHTQIIQVTNLTDAIILLQDERIKFDVILMDYLLNKKDKNENEREKDENERELATDFFKWFDGKCDDENNYLVKNTEDIFKDKNISSKEIRNKIKINRGPLGKLWIFPITAFNQTLLDDLLKNSIRLIDYYWHINKGADPITTPYLFLKELNLFLYLQLENSVYTLKSIEKFINKNTKLIKDSINSKNNDTLNQFHAVMGAEYSLFIALYFNRPILYKDKETSLFSKYIWEEFMNKKKYEILFEFSQAYQNFLRIAAFGSKIDFQNLKYALQKCIYILENMEKKDSESEDEIKKILVNLNIISKKINSIYH